MNNTENRFLIKFFFFLGIVFLCTFNWNGTKPKPTVYILETVNDTAVYVFKPKFDKTYHYHYKADKRVEVDCFIPDSIRFVNKEKNSKNRILITLKYRKK